MNAEQKKSIKSTILECRDILEKDIEQALINYGIYINKDWINLRDLKNLTEDTVTLTCSLLPSIIHFLSSLKRRGSSVVGKTLTSPFIPWVDVMTPTLNISST